MTLLALYPSKKALREHIGQPLKYRETSFHGPEYKPDGVITVCNRPTLTGLGREWFGRVHLKEGKIVSLE